MKCFEAASVLVFALCMHNAFAVNKLDEKFIWKEVSFAWPSDTAKTDAITSKQYVPENNLPLGLEVWKNKLFITVPRWKAGVASSLNYIDLSTTEKSPILHPYPSWEANTIDSAASDDTAERVGGHDNAGAATISKDALLDNSTIISTFRIRVDECDRLWVMDTGLADILGNPKQIAPPALVIFDLNTNKLIRRYAFTSNDQKDGTFFANVIVDIPKKDDCDNAFAYVPDLGAYGVVVYSFKTNKSWRVKHNFFHFDPLNGDYNVGGVNFQWTDGVFGMALGRPSNTGSRDVYFHALSSTQEFRVKNFILQNETRATSPDSYYDYSLVGSRGQNGQSSAEYFDEKSNVLFYTQVNKDSVQCWKADKEYNVDTQGIIDSDSDALVFPNDLKVDGDDLWVLSDRMPIFLFRKLNPEEYNYRILKGKISEMIKGTPCE